MSSRWRDFDVYLLLTTLVVMGFGVVSIWSAVGGGTLTPGNKGVQQAIFGAIGLLLMFAIAVMDELGFDLKTHKPKTFDSLEDTSFDLIISLSPEAHHRALEMTRTMACDVELWNTFDPSIVEGSHSAICGNMIRMAISTT